MGKNMKIARETLGPRLKITKSVKNFWQESEHFNAAVGRVRTMRAATRRGR